MDARHRRIMVLTCLCVLLSLSSMIVVGATGEINTEGLQATETTEAIEALDPTVILGTEVSDNQPTEITGVQDQQQTESTEEQETAVPDTTGSFQIEETEPIPVTDIVISDYEDVLEVDATLNLTTTVIPSTATAQTVSYASSDLTVATVSQTGEVKGISAGKVTITISCGGVEKKIELTVKVSAKLIEVNESYVLLKPDETFQLKTSIFPQNASNKAVEYSTGDAAVATVSSTGLITAKSYGSTNIIIKNEDTLTAVSVIVNNNDLPETSRTENDLIIDKYTINERMTISACPIVDSDMLQYLYRNKRDLYIEAADYVLKIPGELITNFNNTVRTDIELNAKQDSISFTLNEKRDLCGTITLCIYDANEYKYLYLYNDTTKKYDLIKKNDLRELDITTPGEYLLAKQLVFSEGVSWWWIGISGLVVLILLIVYIFLKKKYWFW